MFALVVTVRLAVETTKVLSDQINQCSNPTFVILSNLKYSNIYIFSLIWISFKSFSVFLFFFFFFQDFFKFYLN